MAEDAVIEQVIFDFEAALDKAIDGLETGPHAAYTALTAIARQLDALGRALIAVARDELREDV